MVGLESSMTELQGVHPLVVHLGRGLLRSWRLTPEPLALQSQVRGRRTREDGETLRLVLHGMCWLRLIVKVSVERRHLKTWRSTSCYVAPVKSSQIWVVLQCQRALFWEVGASRNMRRGVAAVTIEEGLSARMDALPSLMRFRSP